MYENANAEDITWKQKIVTQQNERKPRPISFDWHVKIICTDNGRNKPVYIIFYQIYIDIILKKLITRIR